MVKRWKSFPVFLFKKVRRKFSIGTYFCSGSTPIIEDYIKDELLKHDPTIEFQIRTVNSGVHRVVNFKLDGDTYFYCSHYERDGQYLTRLIGVYIFKHTEGDKKLTLLSRPYLANSSDWRKIANFWENYFYLA